MKKEIIVLEVKISGYKIVYTAYKEKRREETRKKDDNMLTVEVSCY